MDYMAKARLGQHRAAGSHGGARGDQVNRGSRTFEGRFGRLFRTLPAAEFEIESLTGLGWAMTADPERASKDKNDPRWYIPVASPETPDKLQDGEENSAIASGYTYLGQFIDHDITFDPASSLQKQNDPDGLIDFRTPALDLDSVYGRGPDDQPYMYDSAGRKFLLGKQLTLGGAGSTSRDLPRFKGELQGRARAIIGDKRNDENTIIAQLHSTFLQFHNRLADENPGVSFKDLQRLVRWHYQFVVLNDFLPTIVGEETMNKVWPDWQRRSTCDNQPNLCFYHYRKEPFIPIEFSAAAYRFGHSMVRPVYRLSTQLDDTNVGSDSPSIQGRFFIFAGVQGRGLNGFDEFPNNRAIDWSLFFDIDGSGAKGGKERVQPAYKIDTSLANPLGFLPEFSMESSFVGPGPVTLDRKPDNLRPLEKQQNPPSPSNLAVRNLWRGNRMGLPSGQDIARAMGEAVLADDELLIGKAQLENGNYTTQPLNNFVVDKLGTFANRFVGNAPLWFYVLAEAQHYWRQLAQGKPDAEANAIGVKLGPVGGRIVAETLIGLLLGDSNSYLNQHPKWQPFVANERGRFTMGSFVKYALRL